jgi:hypothetical protein
MPLLICLNSSRIAAPGARRRTGSCTGRARPYLLAMQATSQREDEVNWVVPKIILVMVSPIPFVFGKLRSAPSD